MKKVVKFDNKAWHDHDLPVFFASKGIAWSTVTKWYYAALGGAFIVGVIIGSVL